MKERMQRRTEEKGRGRETQRDGERKREKDIEREGGEEEGESECEEERRGSSWKSSGKFKEKISDFGPYCDECYMIHEYTDGNLYNPFREGWTSDESISYVYPSSENPSRSGLEALVSLY